MAFRFQLTCDSFLLMPRDPTAAELLFDMEVLFVVFSSLSFDYLAWGGRLIVCSIFFVLFARCYFRHNFLLSISHFSGKEKSIFSFILRKERF
jgi:hypothetical protein